MSGNVIIEEIAFAYVILKKYHDTKSPSGPSFDIRQEILLDGLHWAFKNDLKQLFLLDEVNQQELFLTSHFQFTSEDDNGYLKKVSKIFQGGVEKPIDIRSVDPAIVSFLLGEFMSSKGNRKIFVDMNDLCAIKNSKKLPNCNSFFITVIHINYYSNILRKRKEPWSEGTILFTYLLLRFYFCIYFS